MARKSRIKHASPVTGMDVLRIAQVRRPDDALSSAQKRFKKLLKNLQKQRQELLGWRKFAQHHQSRVHGELLPLGAKLRERRVALAHVLDDLVTSEHLNRREREYAREILSHVLSKLLDECPTPELIALHDKYSFNPYSQVQEEEFEGLRDMAEHFGLDPREYSGAANADDFTDWMESKLHASRSEEEETLEGEGGGEGEPTDPEAPRRRRRGEAGDAGGLKSPEAQAEEERQVGAAADAKARLTKLFRRLASLLHPDRPTNETKAQRDRKELLFKLASAARDEGDMLTLLEIELELGLAQRGARSVGDTKGMAAEHLAAYLHLLDTQTRSVKSQIAQVLMRLGLDPNARKSQLKPAAVTQALNEQIAIAQNALDALNADIALFEDPREVRGAVAFLWEAIATSYEPESYLDADDAFSTFNYAPSPPKRRRRR
jgi:hypothetical protein